jgi:hypothetical protein
MDQAQRTPSRATLGAHPRIVARSSAHPC